MIPKHVAEKNLSKLERRPEITDLLNNKLYKTFEAKVYVPSIHSSCTNRNFIEVVIVQKSNQLYVDNIRGVAIGEIQRIVGSLIPKDEVVHVHVVPFSHVDPGWLQTYDEYTSSTNQILTSMLEFLIQNPDMTFIWMETVFFAHWWKMIDESQRLNVKK
uniref:Glycoside hydrolase family 38 N-terminal domain-containing protein n=1 Tax=Romanomermis culicivorax TaxID=13658 RepID=A0A915IET9_ROMCU